MINPQFRPYPKGHGALWTTVLVFLQSFRCDYIMQNGNPSVLFGLCALKQVFPFHRCRLVVLDILLSRPRSTIDRIKVYVRCILLKKVHRILLYYKDTSAIRRWYPLPANRFAYIPFKINQYELVSTTPVYDGGYVFCGGKTRRDFQTFIKAVDALDLPVKIATTENADIRQHGSYLTDDALPNHIAVTRLDGSALPFIRLMAGARLVVLPIIPDITGTGISVYITAMALRKCVIISAGPATEDILTDNLAIIVPPEDPNALRAAISRAYTDTELRTRLAANAYRYARQLGGEDRLFTSIVTYLVEDFLARPSRD
jgi:glycosyltransferase involved in cell wall biosynthesis